MFFADERPPREIVYEPKQKAYRLVVQNENSLSNSEILAVCKILLESRSLRRDEMMPILDKLVSCCVPAEKRASVAELLTNERFHYIEPQHKKHVLDGLWEIGQAVQKHQVMEITYAKLKGTETVQRVVEPVHQLGDRFNKAELCGRKLNIAGEIKGSTLRDISTFKSITGSDQILAERKGKDPFYYTPRTKLIFAGNTIPSVAETDATSAFSNRLVVLLFNYSIEKGSQDKDLPEKLWNERDSILTLAMDALRKLRLNKYQFSMPEESLACIRSICCRGNSVREFVDDNCILSPQERSFNRDLYKAYEDFCSTNGYTAFNRNRFYELLSGYPGVQKKKIRIGSETLQGHIGIGIKKENALPY